MSTARLGAARREERFPSAFGREPVRTPNIDTRELEKRVADMQHDGSDGDYARHAISRRQLLARGTALGGAVLGGSLLSACGASSSGATSTASATPKRGGVLKLGISGGGSSDTLDPIQAVSNIDYYRADALFECVYWYDTDFNLRPQLAEWCTPNHDATVWDVRLRSGIEFHNGKTLTADDLLFTLRHIFKVPFSGLSSHFGVVDLKGIKKLDTYTLRIPLKYPFSVFPDQFGSMQLIPVGFDPHHPVGTGPFMFKSFEAGRQSTFVRNPNWWGSFWNMKGTPYLDELQMIDLADDTARVNGLLSGQVDAIDDVPFGQATSLKGQGLNLFNVATGNWRPFTMRVDVPPFNDVRVRQAMRLIVDRQQIIDQALAGYGTLGKDLYSPRDPAYISFNAPQRQQDLEQAKSLLKQAGQEDLRIQMTTSQLLGGIVEASSVFVTQAKQAGVTISLSQVDPDTFFGKNYLKWPFAVDWWTPLKYLDQAVIADGPQSVTNETHWNNPAFSNAYYAALKETDAAKREPYEHEMMQLQYDQGGYIIWGFANTLDAYSNKVKGLIPTVWGQDFSDSAFWRLWLA
jgi:peptide/nickel transport system substrate-binding protein